MPILNHRFLYIGASIVVVGRLAQAGEMLAAAGCLALLIMSWLLVELRAANSAVLPLVSVSHRGLRRPVEQPRVAAAFAYSKMGSQASAGQGGRASVSERRMEVMEALGRLMVEVRDSADVREQIVLAFVEGLRCARGCLWELAVGDGGFVAQSEVRPPGESRPSMVGTRIGLPDEGVAARSSAVVGPIIVEEENRALLIRLLGEELSAAYELPSLVFVPLFHFTQLIGFLLLDQPQGRRQFEESDLTVASAAATYAALVLENMRNRIAEQEQGERMTRLARLSATLTTRHSLPEVLQAITKQGAALTGSSTCTILLVEDEDMMRLVGQVGLADESIGYPIPLDDPTVSKFVQMDGPLIVEDVDRDLPELRGLLIREDVKALHVFPLRVAGAVIGALTLGYLNPYRPARADLDLAETLASVAAGAIQNARAFELEVEQRNLLRTVAEISRRVSGILDMEWMLQEVCELLGRELGFDHVHAFMVQSNGTELSYAAGSGQVGRRILETHVRLPVNDETLLGQTVRSSAPRRSGEANGRPFGQGFEELAQVRSEIALPIIAHNQVIGVLAVQSNEPNSFTREDERLLKIVTDQVAVALDNARHHSEVQAQARLDSLTQVLNHGAFVSTLHAMVDHSRQERMSLSLIMLDVDRFKEYNDQFGHVAGDAALKTTVQAIRAHVKSRDAVGRWGGEEFGVALLGADKEQAKMVAQRIRDTLSSLVPVDRIGREMPAPSVSQGIATLDLDARDADTLVDVADQALYRAKEAGRDQVRVAGDADDPG